MQLTSKELLAELIQDLETAAVCYGSAMERGSQRSVEYAALAYERARRKLRNALGINVEPVDDD